MRGARPGALRSVRAWPQHTQPGHLPGLGPSLPFWRRSTPHAHHVSGESGRKRAPSWLTVVLAAARVVPLHAAEDRPLLLGRSASADVAHRAAEPVPVTDAEPRGVGPRALGGRRGRELGRGQGRASVGVVAEPKYIHLEGGPRPGPGEGLGGLEGGHSRGHNGRRRGTSGRRGGGRGGWLGGGVGVGVVVAAVAVVVGPVGARRRRRSLGWGRGRSDLESRLEEKSTRNARISRAWRDTNARKSSATC
jgi:hypothetical protein